MPWQKQTLISYQVMGETLKAAKPVLQELCLNGTLSAEDCSNVKVAYNQAVDIYKLLGNQALIAIDVGDDSVYKQLAAQLMQLLVVLGEYQGGILNE